MAAVVICDSVMPLREMLKPSPWLQPSATGMYVVNAYGVFGSIDAHRDLITLEATNVTLPAAAAKCADATGGVWRNPQGMPVGCGGLLQFCNHPDMSAGLRAACPVTCSACLKPDAVGGWRSLEFAALPGDVGRRPPLLAPYHRRLDWQVRFETKAGIKVGGAAGPLFPPLLRRVIEGVLAGDADVLSLLDASADVWVDHPPTAVRATYQRYRFTTPSERAETGAWWAATPWPIEASVFFPRATDPQRHPRRQRPGPRHLAMATAVLGFVASAGSATSAIGFLAALAAALFADYEAAWAAAGAVGTPADATAAAAAVALAACGFEMLFPGSPLRLRWAVRVACAVFLCSAG